MKPHEPPQATHVCPAPNQTFGVEGPLRIEHAQSLLLLLQLLRHPLLPSLLDSSPHGLALLPSFLAVKAALGAAATAAAATAAAGGL